MESEKSLGECEETKSFSPLIKRVVGDFRHTDSKVRKCERHKFKEEKERSELKEKKGSS